MDTWTSHRGESEQREDANEARLALHEYVAAIEEGWTDDELGRAILHDLPRRFHELDRDAQAAALATEPALTETRWDALLAATVEHIATLHGHEAPRWTDHPARFLREPWVMPKVDWMRSNALAFAPAAFIRHGAIPDPRELDRRCGEHRAWVP